MPNLTQITMRRTPPAKTGDWCRIEAKKGESKTKVYIYDEIGFWGTSAADFASQLDEIDTKEIELHLNSPGGQVFDGLAIYNSLKNHDAKVTVYVDALAASAASFIAQAGDEIIMSRNATLMIHDAMGICIGNAADMDETKKILDGISDNIADIYAFNAGGEVSDWRSLMKAETWYNAFEAKDAGLADTVLDSEDEEAEKETNKWDLSIFNYAGRDHAPSPALQKFSVMNRVKEAQMGDKSPKNTDGGTVQPDPASDPASGTTPPEPNENDNPGESTSDEPPSVPAQPATQPAPESQPGNKFGLMVNGAKSTDMAAVQAHINHLEGFRKETIQNGRIEFVKGLAAANKIAATQIGNEAEGDTPATGLIAFALTLNDEQFASWKESMNSAPASSLFSQHGIDPKDSNAPQNQSATNVADRISVLENIVADLRRSGLTEEQIATKNSYKELQTLKSQQSTQTQ